VFLGTAGRRSWRGL